MINHCVCECAFCYSNMAKGKPHFELENHLEMIGFPLPCSIPKGHKHPAGFKQFESLNIKLSDWYKWYHPIVRDGERKMVIETSNQLLSPASHLDPRPRPPDPCKPPVESHVVLLPSLVSSEEGLHDPSAVALAGSEGVHSALTAVLLGTGIGWVTGFAATFAAQPAAGSRADSAVEIVLLAHADIGWVIDFVETSVVLVPAGIGWAVGFAVGLAVVSVAG